MNKPAKRILKAVLPPLVRQALKNASIFLFCRLKGRAPVAWKNSYMRGVNLIGHIRGDFGLGESCRLVAGGLAQSGIPFSVRNVSAYGNAPETNDAWQMYERDDLPYGINIVHLNADELLANAWNLGVQTFKGRYNIGFFLWEQMEFPEKWKQAFDLVDEVWTPAEFISAAVRKRTEKPVYTMPYGLPVPPTDIRCDRAHFGLPDTMCLFLISYDGKSSSDRKNPMGSVRAFCRAFSPDDPVGLVIKATHAQDEELLGFRELLKEYPHVYILTDSYSKAAFNSLVACVDVYVSLHRAEGFGLVMAEAMLLGTAVIATNWSANTEFMNEQVACMVPAAILTLQADSFPYEKGSHWADPDERIAAGMMRRLYEDPGLRAELAAKAQTFAREKLSPAQASQKMEHRLNELLDKEKTQR